MNALIEELPEIKAWPVDFDTLEKDQEIPREAIERAYEVKRKDNPDGYRLALLRLKNEIESHRPDLLIRIRGDHLRVMTDREAEDHTWEQGRKAVSMLGKSSRRRAAIMRDGFNDSERRAGEARDSHLQGLALMARRLLIKADRDVRRLLGVKGKD